MTRGESMRRLTSGLRSSWATSGVRHGSHRAGLSATWRDGSTRTSQGETQGAGGRTGAAAAMRGCRGTAVTQEVDASQQPRWRSWYPWDKAVDDPSSDWISPGGRRFADVVRQRVIPTRRRPWLTAYAVAEHGPGGAGNQVVRARTVDGRAASTGRPGKVSTDVNRRGDARGMPRGMPGERGECEGMRGAMAEEEMPEEMREEMREMPHSMSVVDRILKPIDGMAVDGMAWARRPGRCTAHRPGELSWWTAVPCR